jgi:hypothetical protein
MFKMKKSLVAALAGMFVVSAAGTSFAAANPFSDVPAGHWAYESVTKLANDGVIEGYGDGTYRGNRNITRYEMAQMVARALARTPRTTISTSNRAELDKLAAEFRDELDSLGVRIAELEKHSDFVKWQGKIEYTYGQLKNKDTGAKSSGNGGVFRLEPTAEVNDHWKAIARFDANFDMKDDFTTDAKLKRVYAQGDYDKFSVKLGRFGFCAPVEDGLAVDTVVAGAGLTFGSKWQFTATGGRIGGNSDEAHFDRGRNDNTDIVGINIGYDQGEHGLYGLASWYSAKDDDFYTINKEDLSKGNPADKANVWGANLGYRFSDNFKLWGGYARNTDADWEKDAWQAEMRFGNYGDYAERGDWALWAGYAKFGQNVAIASSQGDDIQTGTKGWHVGVAYAPFKNVGVLARYADGKYITSGDKFRKVFVRGEWFF